MLCCCLNRLSRGTEFSIEESANSLSIFFVRLDSIMALKQTKTKKQNNYLYLSKDWVSIVVEGAFTCGSVGDFPVQRGVSPLETFNYDVEQNKQDHQKEVTLA